MTIYRVPSLPFVFVVGTIPLHFERFVYFMYTIALPPFYTLGRCRVSQRFPVHHFTQSSLLFQFHLCPVAAFARTSNSFLGVSHTPAFVFLDKGKVQWLTTSIFIRTFRGVMAAGGQDASDFSGHSFRRGGATWAFQSGMPGELIQICGDWASDAYTRYLEFSTQNKLDLAALLIKNLPG